MRTRTEQVQWAKARALEYLPQDPTNAIASLMSDLNKHPETQRHAAQDVLLIEQASGKLKTADQVRVFIEGIN